MRIIHDDNRFSQYRFLDFLDLNTTRDLVAKVFTVIFDVLKQTARDTCA